MNLNSTLLAAAATGILVGMSACGGSTPAPAASGGTSAMPAAKNTCKAGQNACGGKGGCKTADHACNGQNSCKGKGGDSGQ